MTIKKALFIENEFFSSMEHTEIDRVYKKLVEAGVECRIIDQASKHKAEVYEGALWADSIFFASTFVYADEVKGVGDLLMKVKEPKQIHGYCMSSQGLVYEIEDIWSLKELAQMAHHSLYEIQHGYVKELESEYPWRKPIDLVCYAEAWKKEEDERIAKNNGFPKTGRQVKILNIQAQGKQWSLLKEGMIVSELDCSEIDENPKRGIWVMGLDEPVKLLNSDGYNEWQYADLHAESLSREFFARGNALDRHESIDILATWINGSGISHMEPGKLWEWCDTICETVGVERRGNRSYFEKRLIEYGKKYTYFREIAR